MIENGGGSFSVEWALVQPELAKYTRVCTYDRAGYAWSDPAAVVDDIEQITSDLSLMLRKERIGPPVVVVGASLGAISSRAYQRRFPEDVVGLVFVDGTHDEAVTLPLNGKQTPISILSRDELAAAYEEYERIAPKPKAGPSNAPPLDRLAPALQNARNWALQKMISEVGLLPNGMAGAESWRQEFTALRRQRLSKEHPLGNLPLIVLERSEGADESWHVKQIQLAGLSTAGKLIRAEGSGHMIHLYRPDLVVNAVREVLAASRRRG